MGAMGLRWRNWYLRVLPAYWVFLFCTTHFPRLQIDNAPPQSDKVLHFVAFGMLAFLFWRFFEAAGAIGPVFAWIATVVLVFYAGMDEYLQQFVGRSSDWEDFSADCMGILIVLFTLEFRRRWSSRHA